MKFKFGIMFVVFLGLISLNQSFLFAEKKEGIKSIADLVKEKKKMKKGDVKDNIVPESSVIASSIGVTASTISTTITSSTSGVKNNISTSSTSLPVSSAVSSSSDSLQSIGNEVSKVKKLKKDIIPQSSIKEVKIKEKKQNIKFTKFYIYKDAGYKENNYVPTGWMGDYGDLRMSARYFIKPKTGSSCIKIGYSAKLSQGNGWAGIYWQNPANNWATENKGFDLTGAKKLEFYIKGEKGGEIIDNFKLGGITGTYPDTADVSFGPIILTKSWKKYEIDLKGYNLSHIIGGFCFVLTAESNPEGCIFYLDEIVIK